MKKIYGILLAALLLISGTTAFAVILLGADGEIMDNITVAPDESLEITAARAPLFVNMPKRCQQSIPVRIVVTAAETAELLYSDQDLLGESSPLLTATLPPSLIQGRKLQVGVLVNKRLASCIFIDYSAVDETGVLRRLSFSR